MNPIEAIRLYIDKMVQASGPGMKILLMDKETTAVVSSVYTQTEIMQKEVYLCDRLDNINRDPVRYLKCLTFLRPTEDNISLLARELQSPLYGSYFLHWSNIISKSDVKRLAESDEHEVVREIAEYFADFIPLNSHTFISNTPHGIPFADGDIMNEKVIHSIAISIISYLLSVKKYPTIRYTEWSGPTRKLADKLHNLMNKENNLFDYQQRQQVKPILLILDRRDDCVTPLLNQWTYEAMVHELLTIKNHRVSLRDAPGVTKDFKEVVLTTENDQFFAKNLYADFGQVGQSLRELVEDFQKNVKTHQKVESIEEMKSFIENYPQFKQLSGTVSKHVALVGELARLNEKYSLLEVSELEQEIACHNNHSQCLQRIKQLIINPKIRDIDALRLVLLYSLKFETHSNNDIMGLMTKLKGKNLLEEDISVVKSILKFGGAKRRKSDLFGSDPVAVTKRFIKGLQGVENIYTQHTPWMKYIIDELLRGKLKESQFPYFTRDSSSSDPNFRPAEIIIFVIGGITYEESLAIHQMDNRIQIVLGGTDIHNMSSFLEEIKAYKKSITAKT